ncbi:MAG: hypothetical protein Q4B26_18670 [Eubacteriales bacterium]|nr:hypothetical protein [Eubacteriales bacterium]
MQNYTQYIASKRKAIEPESRDYVENLIEITRSFRPFDASLDAFLLERGYAGDITDIEDKADFIEAKFKDAGIPKPRNVRDWYRRHTRPDGTRRVLQIQLCFAFDLSLEEAKDFFRRVCLERDFDCHDLNELVYYFALKNGIGYPEARGIIARLPKAENIRINDVEDVIYTQRIRDEVESFTTEKELLDYIKDHIFQFGYNNASGTIRIQELWDELSGEDGLCKQERELLYRRDDYLSEDEIKEIARSSGQGKKERRVDATSTFGILLQILGLSDTYTSRWGKDRSLKPFLTGNDAIHPIAESVFPDRDGIEKVLHGEHVSYERIRKILILLLFYKFWIEIALENAEDGEEFPYEDIGDNEQRFAAYINDELSDVGLQVLYEGNPYDWIFLFASSAKVDEDILSPLDNFRGYMKQLISIKELDT